MSKNRKLNQEPRSQQIMGRTRLAKKQTFCFATIILLPVVIHFASEVALSRYGIAMPTLQAPLLPYKSGQALEVVGRETTSRLRMLTFLLLLAFASGATVLWSALQFWKLNWRRRRVAIVAFMFAVAYGGLQLALSEFEVTASLFTIPGKNVYNSARCTAIAMNSPLAVRDDERYPCPVMLATSVNEPSTPAPSASARLLRKTVTKLAVVSLAMQLALLLALLLPVDKSHFEEKGTSQRSSKIDIEVQLYVTVSLSLCILLYVQSWLQWPLYIFAEDSTPTWKMAQANYTNNIRAYLFYEGMVFSLMIACTLCAPSIWRSQITKPKSQGMYSHAENPAAANARAQLSDHVLLPMLQNTRYLLSLLAPIVIPQLLSVMTN